RSCRVDGDVRRGRPAVERAAREVREADVKSPRPYFVASVFPVGDRLWLGEFANPKTGAVWLFAGGAMRRLAIETEAVKTIGGGENELWVGTNRRGAFLLKPEKDDARLIEHLTFENTAGGLRSNQINAVFRDREGVVWFGTDRGVCRYDRESFRATTLSGDSNSNYVRDLLLASGGELWCGTNRGLFRLASPESAAAQVAELENRSVYSLIEDAAGAIWAGTSDGLFVKSKDAASFIHVTETPTTTITIEGENSADDSALTPANPKSETPQSKESVRAVASFRGQVYAAFFGRGIERIDDNKLIPALPKLNDAAARRAICLAVEGDKALWFGTSDGELWRYDGSQLRRIDAPIAGQGEKAIRAIAFAGEKLWLASSQGVFVREAETFREVRGGFDAQDLLLAREPSGREVVWVATKNAGLIKLLPELLPNENVSIRFDTEQGLSSQQVFALAAPAA
ncbi:MAG: two-component regulator propeller domain-containing protein, partial [Acidobacteriota bacterium]